MGKTSIEWTDYSWPITNGCRRVSAGCEHCYAERLIATRLSHMPKYQGLAVYGKNGPRWTGESRLWIKHLDMPFKLKDPSKIFVADMGDLFYEQVTNEEIAAVFAVMAANPHHTFQVLTKRPERARAWFRWVLRDSNTPPQSLLTTHLINAGIHVSDEAVNCVAGVRWPLPNVWLGVSVEDQATADERIPVLLDIPAAVRFVSAEPMIGPVDLARWLGAIGGQAGHCVDIDGGWWHQPGACRGAVDNCSGRCCARGLDWIIVGGESGPGARPFAVEWAERLIEQCARASVPIFVKQLGANVVSEYRMDGDRWAWRAGLTNRKGGDMEEWPNELRVREFPL